MFCQVQVQVLCERRPNPCTKHLKNNHVQTRMLNATTMFYNEIPCCDHTRFHNPPNVPEAAWIRLLMSTSMVLSDATVLHRCVKFLTDFSGITDKIQVFCVKSWNIQQLPINKSTTFTNAISYISYYEVSYNIRK